MTDSDAMICHVLAADAVRRIFKSELFPTCQFLKLSSRPYEPLYIPCPMDSLSNVTSSHSPSLLLDF